MDPTKESYISRTEQREYGESRRFEEKWERISEKEIEEVTIHKKRRFAWKIRERKEKVKEVEDGSK